MTECSPVRLNALARIALIAGLAFHWAATHPCSAQDRRPIELPGAVRNRCLAVLRAGMHSDEFWPSIHAAEGLTLGGHGEEVVAELEPKLPEETDDQHRCGLARELVRAGRRLYAAEMLAILAGDNPYGHVHAAESLYKVWEIGDGRAMRAAFAQTDNLRLKIMAAAALGRCGNPRAMSFLRQTLDHEDPEISRTVAWVLGRIGSAADIPPIRKRIASAPDELTRAYYEHSLAALGDAKGLAALEKNLSSQDGAVRTYAATFAGDAWATGVKGRLIEMLDDEHLDARLRAAQSLLQFTQPPPPDPNEDVSQIVYASTEEHPRYTEGSVLELSDGSLLFAVTEFQGSGSDFAQAQIVARRSHDLGRTWGRPRVLQKNTGGRNVMSVTLRRLRPPAAPGTVAMFYLEKNSYSDLDLMVRFSRDEAETFGEPVRITATPGYHVVNNDRIVQLSSGRLLAPAASTPDVRKDNHFVSRCFLSDDGGLSWRPGRGEVDYEKRGAMEPEVLELSGGDVLMIFRTQSGHIGTSRSRDGGETWSAPKSWGVTAPEAPATLRRIPATGDLVLIWNNTYQPGAGHGGKRTPLTAAVSSDEGATWEHIQNLESDPNRTFSYPSLTFSRNRAVLSYWDSDPGSTRLNCRFRSLPVAWFYEN